MADRNGFSTLAIRAGYNSADHFNSVNPPIYQTASFDLHDIDRTRRLWTGAEGGGIYSRVGNPTGGILEERIAALEGGKAAVALSSGMAAQVYTLLLLGQGGGNIVSGSSLYGAAMLAMIKFLPQYGITAKFVEKRDDPAEYEKLIDENTKAVYLESISNPNIELYDIDAIAEAAHRHGVPVIVDNTVATPYLYRPFEHGADIVIYSATKELNGHGNTIAGLVVEKGDFPYDEKRFPQFYEKEWKMRDLQDNRRSPVEFMPGTPVIASLKIFFTEFLGGALGSFESYMVLQGLSTLKIYQADAARHVRMDGEAEHFRVVTMKVLTMQLNSIIVMDIVALGGAAAGIAVALFQLAAGRIDLLGCLLIVLLSADFFIPMRRLGSYFHVAMNGMAAADKIFRLLALDEPEARTLRISEGDAFELRNLCFGYGDGREVLHDVTLSVAPAGLTAIVGESGSGKSTIATLLAGGEDAYTGELLLGNKQVRDISRDELARFVTTVPSGSYLFAGTVCDNLLMANPEASDERLWQALDQASLGAYLRTQDGLDTQVGHEGDNLSGGQRQRLALARALVSDAQLFILDEATSNIDVESEEAIMASVHELARTRAVLVISHRLANVVKAQRIYVLEDGRVVGAGTHEELLATCEPYRTLWDTQQRLERFGRGDRHAA